MNNKLLANLVAFITVIIWGLTFISTKILLTVWSPLEILFIRFALGWLALCMLTRAKIPFYNGKLEFIYMLAGLSGVTLYFLLENVALTMTFAANVSVLVSTTPFFTAICAWRILGAQAMSLNFYFGFVLAMLGIYLISFSDQNLALNPFGDFLALLASFAWAFYSIFTRILGKSGYDSLAITRRIFFYGLVFMLPVMIFQPFSFKLNKLFNPVYLLNFLFLGLGASALCFVSWTWCIKKLGASHASIWIYLVPVITVISASLILNEHICRQAWLGIILTFAGLAISEKSVVEFFLNLIGRSRKFIFSNR